MAKKKRKAARSLGVSRRMSTQDKFSLAWKNLMLFLALFLISTALYGFSSNPLMVNLFGLLSIILGFLTLAFFIITIVLSILKSEKR